MNGTRSLSAALVFPAVLVCGCASVPPPTDTVQSAERAIVRATQADAEPHARLDLHLAREHLDKARKAMEKERYDEAREFAERALVEAELAEAKANAARARHNVAEIREHIATLRREIERSGSSH